MQHKQRIYYVAVYIRKNYVLPRSTKSRERNAGIRGRINTRRRGVKIRNKGKEEEEEEEDLQFSF
jgi:hypothetical protein